MAAQTEERGLVGFLRGPFAQPGVLLPVFADSDNYWTQKVDQNGRISAFAAIPAVQMSFAIRLADATLVEFGLPTDLIKPLAMKAHEGDESIWALQYPDLTLKYGGATAVQRAVRHDVNRFTGLPCIQRELSRFAEHKWLSSVSQADRRHVPDDRVDDLLPVVSDHELTSTADDAQLARRVRAGDREAEELLFARYYKRVLFVVRNRTQRHDVAEDLAMDAFVTVIQALREGKVREPDRLSAYVHQVAHYKWIEYVRKNAKDPLAHAGESQGYKTLLSDQIAMEQFVEREKLAGAIRSLLDEMPNARDRNALVLYYIDQHDKADVCKVLGVSPLQLSRILSRARSRFAHLLRQSGVADDLAP